VIDDEAPVITLLGDQFLTVCRWDDFADPGVVVSDNLDGLVEPEIVSNVDVNWQGLYTIRYNAIDEAGNRSTAERVIRVIDCMTGMEESIGNAVNVYPNPSKGNVTIESEGLDLSNARVIVRDILGRTVPATFTTKGNTTLETDLSAQPAGTYFISIVSGNDIVTKKIQIVK
jgi:hypothetical protein